MSEERNDSSKGPESERASLDAPATSPRPDATSAPDYGGGARDSEGLDPRYYLRVLYKRRWAAITVFLLVAVTATVWTFTLIPIYEARARVLIDAERLNLVSFQDILEQERSSGAYYQTQYSILRSRSLARKTLASLNLRSESEPSLPDWVELPLPDETVAEARRVDAFLAGLVISPVPNSRLVDVKYRSPDPVLAANMANAVTREYINQNREFRFQASEEGTAWLGERLSDQREEVEASERALQRYREQHGVVSVGGQESIVLQKLFDLTTAVTGAKTTRIEREAVYNQLSAIQSGQGSLDAFPPVLANSYIQRLRAELVDLLREQAKLSEVLGARHPDMIRVRSAVQDTQAKLAGEIDKVVESVRAEFLAAQAAEESLVEAFDAQKRDALALNQEAIEFAVLQREAESNRQIYDILMQRVKETGITGELRTNKIRVIDPAEVPRAAVWPNRPRQLRLAAFWALAAALGLVFFFESFDNRLKLPEHVKSDLGLPLLGWVPAISTKGVQAPAVTAVNSVTKISHRAIRAALPLLDNGVPPNFTEALRSVRTNLLFSFAGEGVRSVLVTSTGPAEGKTIVASNLAIAIAQIGRRVLLIDGDLHRPRLHELFTHEQKPGLSDLIVGNAKASEVVLPSGVRGLWVLPSGARPPDATALLGSQRFKSFLADLADQFDWIIIDSPPVMAVSDAAIMAHVIPEVVFVVGAEMTSRHHARQAIEKLETVGAHVLGAVLNRVDLARNAYYYSDYYRRQYGDYYAHQERT